MTKRLHISGGGRVRPLAEHAIFCDGGIDATYREGADLELSHWIPNRTPAEFRADTSTEICMKFLASGLAGHFDLVVNNHVDVDGVLSTFTLIHPDTALRHRMTVVQAAEMGDFFGWGEPPAQRLYQALSCLIDRHERSSIDAEETYLQCFARAQQVLAGERFPECDAGLQALTNSVELIDRRTVARTRVGAHLAHYHLPRQLAGDDLARALSVPSFSDPLSTATLLLPHARARLDRDCVHLVSVETNQGWYYDLWYPGYAWADTVTRWRPPGIRSAGSSNVHVLEHDPLTAAVATLNQRESADGQWSLARKLSPFAALPGRNFPVVLSFMRGDAPCASRQTPAVVLATLAPTFDGAGA